MRKKSMKTTYTFTLIISGVSKLTDKLTNALYESGCDDALVGARNGEVFIDFDRESETFEDAVLSAITQVEGITVLSLEVIRIVPPETLQTLALINNVLAIRHQERLTSGRSSVVDKLLKRHK